MKKILFVIDSLGVGGAEKSLISLLHCFDYNKYEVDLYLMKRAGSLLSLLPKQVSIIEHNLEWKYFQLPLLKSLIKLICKGKFRLVYHRIMIAVKSNLFKMTQYEQQKLWIHFSKAIFPLDKEYDAAIGYMEKYSDYFVVDKVISKRKLGWIHTDYKAYGLNSKFDRKYFERFDNIIGVSDSCVGTLKEIFKDIEGKISLIENITSKKLVYEMANEEVNFKNKEIKIVSAARLAELKGIDLSIEAANMLKDAGYEFIWIILGDGPQKKQLESMIKRYSLEKYVILHGTVSNPYPYIKSADIYVQTSRFEGKSISIDEAKILCKPIVATKFPTVYDQINDGQTGILADINAKSIFEKIKFLIDYPEQRNYLQKKLSIQLNNNENEIEKLYRLIG